MKKHSAKLNTERLRKMRTVIPPVPKRFKRVRGEERIQEAFENIPNITNETVAEHREDVLKGARKYKYPLQHTKHRIVIVSTVLLLVSAVGFFVYVGLALYKFQSSSAFVYRVTQVLPFQVARAGTHFVSYENYLFELRRYQHYYQTQQRVDFGTKSGKDQLASYKPKAMDEVVQAAYVKQLAAKQNVVLTNQELTDELDSLRAQNQSSDQELVEVTNKFFGWSLEDLKREIKQEMLAQKVATTLDTAAQTRAKDALTQVQGGADFATVAAAKSEDASTKANGGQYVNTAITLASTDVPPAVVHQLLKMKVGEVSGVVATGSSLEIVKLLANDNGKLKAAHISFTVTPIEKVVADYQKAHARHVYIKVQ